MSIKVFSCSANELFRILEEETFSFSLLLSNGFSIETFKANLDFSGVGLSNNGSQNAKAEQEKVILKKTLSDHREAFLAAMVATGMREQEA